MRPTGGEDVGRNYQIGPGQEGVEVLCDSAVVARVSVAKAISQSMSNNFVFVIILSLLYYVVKINLSQNCFLLQKMKLVLIMIHI